MRFCWLHFELSRDDILLVALGAELSWDEICWLHLELNRDEICWLHLQLSRDEILLVWFSVQLNSVKATLSFTLPV